MKYYNETQYTDWKPDPKYSLSQSEESKYLVKGTERVSIFIYKNERFQVEKSDLINPYKYFYGYSYKSKILLTEFIQLYAIKVGIERQYDETGRLIKEIDYEKPYKFTIEELIFKIKKEYNVNLEDKREGGSISRRENGGAFYYEVHLTLPENPLKREYLLIDGITGKTVFQTFYYMKGGATPFDEFLKSQRKDVAIISTSYKTHNGTSYTRAEWDAYEEKEYEEYCKRTGKTYFPKDQRTVLENNSSKSKFEADDTDLGTPKPKKGFWDNLLG